jgi:hypothetical protein
LLKQASTPASSLTGSNLGGGGALSGSSVQIVDDAASGVPAIDPGWDIARASLLADNETVTMLLATLAADRGDGYFCTFAVSRPVPMTANNPASIKPGYLQDALRGHTVYLLVYREPPSRPRVLTDEAASVG